MNGEIDETELGEELSGVGTDERMEQLKNIAVECQSAPDIAVATVIPILDGNGKPTGEYVPQERAGQLFIPYEPSDCAQEGALELEPSTDDSILDSSSAGEDNTERTKLDQSPTERNDAAGTSIRARTNEPHEPAADQTALKPPKLPAGYSSGTKTSELMPLPNNLLRYPPLSDQQFDKHH